jgi:FlaA1/EpsC-like NDP-sugar epimerase
LKKLLNKNFWIVLILDLIALSLVLYLSFLIRFDFKLSYSDILILQKILPLSIIVKIICFYYFDLYSGMWRYTSLNDLRNIIKASFLSSIIIITILLFTHRFQGFSRSVFLIDLVLTIISISGIRVLIRYYFEVSDIKKDEKNGAHKTKNVLIVGAGNSGEKLYREIKNNPSLGYRAVGFIDDAETKIGLKIHGVPVVANIENLDKAIKKTKASDVIISIPSAGEKQIKRIVDICAKNKIDFKIMPPMTEVLHKEISWRSLRKVAYTDLLGREEIKLDTKRIENYIKDKVVLVTGAGGSIGSELSKQICKFSPKRLLLLDIAETSLYNIEMDIKAFFPHLKITLCLVDIKDKEMVYYLFNRFRPEIVFHAAAYKHVPMMEKQPWQAIDNNILGTLRLIKASIKFSIDKFIFISTDKAVKPTSIMGASKRICELLIQSHNESKVSFIAVRFGNVLGSAGSVIPLFEKQIQKGGPVTVTDPDITRFFMTIPEASLLILQAASMGNKNEIFILDMGRPIKISDLAYDMIKFYGHEPNQDIKIVYTGLRPGEKLYEELYTDKETLLKTEHGKIMIVKSENNIKNQIKNETKNKIDLLINEAKKRDKNIIKLLIKDIIPEYLG